MDYNERILSNCIVLEIIIASVIATAMVLGVEVLVSPLFYISFLVPLLYIARQIRTFQRELFILTVVCFINVTFNGMSNDGAIGFDYYKKVIMFLTFMYLACYCVELNHCRKFALRIIKFIPVVAGVIFVLAYFVLGKTETMAGGILLGFPNPNTAGMWLFHLVLYGIILIFDLSISKLRFLYIPIIIALLYMLQLTLTRGCYIALAFLIIMLVFRIFHIKANKVTCFIILLLPLVYAVVYLNNVDASWFQTNFEFMVSEGKSLTSRVSVWNESFDSIKTHFILGNYSGLSNGTGQSQFHNTHIDVLASYGIVPFVLFIGILFQSMKKVVSRANTFYKYIAFSAFCSVLIMGTFEATMVAGSTGLNLLTIGMLVLANADEVKDTDNNKIDEEI